MVSIVGFSIQDEKIYAKIMAIEVSTDPILVEIPKEVFNGMIKESPPTNGKFIRELSDTIRNFKKDRVFTIIELDKQIDALNKVDEDLQQKAIDAVDPFQLDKIKLQRQLVVDRRANLAQRRHIIRLMYEEESKVTSELIRLQQQ